MPRNIAGVYTLPEAAFVSGTTILSAIVNSDLSDIATALTQSLATTGVSTMTGPIKAASGSVTAPSYTFGSATGTGLYLSAADTFSWTAAGVLQATFAAAGVTWVPPQTFSGTAIFSAAVTFSSTVTFSGALSLTSTLSVVTGTEPAVTIRNSDNDASEHELTRYALGSGAGATASRRLLGAGANDVTEIRDYIGTTEVLRQSALLVNPKKNISVDAGITVIATAGYADLTEIAAPAAPAANVGRIYVKDNGAGLTGFYFKDSTNIETPVTPVGSIVNRAYGESTSTGALSGTIPDDGTIPQNTEGDQIVTAAITLIKSTNRVRARFVGTVLTSDTSDLQTTIGALFSSISADAINVVRLRSYDAGNNARAAALVMEVEHLPGSVGPLTYQVRIGMGGSSYTINPSFSGTARVTLILEEIWM